MKTPTNNQEDLIQFEETPELTPELLKLDSCRIASDTVVPQEEFLMRLFGKPCFPRRDLSTITGLEKCGKTYYTSMLMACCAKKEVLALERISDRPLRVMWYDTEQSRQSTKSILTERIAKLTTETSESQENSEEEMPFDDSPFYVFNVRACSCQERMDCLVAGIQTYKPDLVVIDNVSDLLSSINDGEECVRIIDQLMVLANDNNCNITVVIHLNRSGEKRNLRGWLGTEILHKSYEVYYCEHVENSDVFLVEQTLTRKYRIPETLYYKITDDGLPEATDRPNFQPRDAAGKFMSNKPEAYQINDTKADTFNQKYIVRHQGDNRKPWEWNLRHLFTDALGNCPSATLEAISQKVMQLGGIRRKEYYDKVFRQALAERVIQTTLDRNGRFVVIPSPT